LPLEYNFHSIRFCRAGSKWDQVPRQREMLHGRRCPSFFRADSDQIKRLRRVRIFSHGVANKAFTFPLILHAYEFPDCSAECAQALCVLGYYFSFHCSMPPLKQADVFARLS
jgi:hypothetical protein